MLSDMHCGLNSSFFFIGRVPVCQNSCNSSRVISVPVIIFVGCFVQMVQLYNKPHYLDLLIYTATYNCSLDIVISDFL